MNSTSHSTIILGGGFVGLFAALQLGQQPYPHQIILIDQRDRFVFKPLLYELLTGEMHAEQICPSYTELLARSNVSFVQDIVQSVDLNQRQVVLPSGRYEYSNLVLALGSKTSYFNTPGAAEYTFPLTSAMEAIALKKHLLMCLEQAKQTRDPEARLQWLTVAVIGAGPAGVELACTLADILPVWYDAMGGVYEEIRIVLVNRSSEILKGDINSRLRHTAQASFTERTVAVELLPDAAVTGITPDGVEYIQRSQSDFLAAATVAWTAGTEPHPLLQDLPIPAAHRDRRGRLQVDSTLQLPDFPEVFVGGDCAYVVDDPQPPTAQVAYQQGTAIAQNLRAIAEDRPLVPAHITMRGTLMKLGIGEGIANIFNRFEIKGELGHLMREATYLQLLPTPIYNVRATAEWFKDELFQHHQPQSLNPKHSNRTPVLAGTAAVLAGLLISAPLIWRAVAPQQFQKNLTWTGIPTLLNGLAPSPSSNP